ncbi:MAG: hypothetical protein SWC96_11345 [Thermodesulfobacteriota bacterium]|nr:hypothetical protein [Thermodesulfobacteriota bacterium]
MIGSLVEIPGGLKFAVMAMLLAAAGGLTRYYHHVLRAPPPSSPTFITCPLCWR